MRASIQTRLFAILGLFVLASTLIWALLALLLAYVVEDEIIDRVLASQASQILGHYQSTGELAPPAMAELRVFESAAQAPPEIRPSISPGPGGEIFTADRTHYHYRWLALPGREPLLLVAEVSPWLVVTNISSALLTLVLIGFVVALFLGLLAVATIARITTRPVRELTAAIEQPGSPGDLPHRDKRDEVGVLACAMQDALDGLRDALDREKSFTRDISHELRTPLTTLRNAITLQSATTDAGEHLRQAQQSSDEIEQIVSALLALARAESQQSTPIRLRPMLEELLLERRDALASRGFDLDLQVDEQLEVTGSERLLRLLLGNLLDNALHYAEPAALSIRQQGHSLHLENPLPATGSQPHAQSLGHGLGLVQRLADAQHWRFTACEESGRFHARLDWTG